MGKMKIRGMMARKGDLPEYVNKMQQEVFEVLAEARSLEDLKRIEPRAREVYRSYIDELDGADIKEFGHPQKSMQAELFPEMCRDLG